MKTAKYLIGNAAYDSIKAMEDAIGVNLIPVVELNRRRGKPRRIRAEVGGFLKTNEGQRPLA